MAKKLWAWDISALVYARTYGPVAHALDEALIRHLGDDLTGKVVADIGCGPGVVTRKLLAAGAARVVAVDAVPAMLRQFGDLDGAVPVEARIEPALFERLRAESAPGGFDAIVFKRSLYVDPDAAVEVLRAAWAALAPNGVIFVVHPEAHLPDYALGQPRRLRSYTAYHLFNRFVSRVGERLGGEQYTVYRRDDLLELARRAAGPSAVTAIPFPEPAFNLVAIHRGAAALRASA